jgi:hypothetical protein
MILSEFKHFLKIVTEITFLKPNGKKIPEHFHITEVGQISKKFIDCGGTVRNLEVISMQLWQNIDFLHRLEPSKLNSIIELSEKKLEIGDYEIEIEYQGETIEKYGVVFTNGIFQLVSTNTACLAMDKCGIPTLEINKEKVKSCCTPGTSCC